MYRIFDYHFFLSFITEREVPYPTHLDLEEGRIAVFSANGSHGTWAQPGPFCTVLSLIRRVRSGDTIMKS